MDGGLIFKNMVALRILDETTKNELTLFIDRNTRISIIVGDDGTDEIGTVSLSKEDAVELVKELENLISRM